MLKYKFILNKLLLYLWDHKNLHVFYIHKANYIAKTKLLTRE